MDVRFSKLDGILSNEWQNVIQLRSEIFVSEQQCVYTDPDDLDLIATHAILSESAKIHAYARIYKEDTWHIGRIISHFESRNKGYASHLIRECLAYIQNLDKSATIEMSAQAYLVEFYSKFKFQPVGGLYLEDGIPHLRMVYQP